MKAPPPISVIAQPEESIPSMIRRLEQRTLTPVKKPGTMLTDRVDESVLRSLSGELGIDAAELAAHTLHGRLGSAYWQIPGNHYRVSGLLRCPRCGIQPMWARLWPVTGCSTCGVLLAPEGAPTERSSPEAMALQKRYLHALTGDGWRGDEQFRSFESLLAFHVCTSWPTAPDALATRRKDLPAGSQRAAGWRSPEWIAQFAATAWPAAATAATFQDHITRVATSQLLEKDAFLDTDDPGALRELLHRELVEWGLEPRHLPAHLLQGHSPFDTCHLAAIGSAIPRALSREIARAGYGRVPPGHGLVPEKKRREPLKKEHAAMRHFLEHEAAGIQVLRYHARMLAQPDPAARIDYPVRRAILAANRRLPASVVSRLTPMQHNRNTAMRGTSDDLGRDAAAWLWIELGAGPLYKSPYSSVNWLRVRALNKRLTPEDRLVLLEYGSELLGAVADDVTRPHVAHRHGEAKDMLTDVG